MTGSVTPIYTYWKPAMERIRDYHPGIKLIVLLRNPIDRAFSHWNMYRERKQEDLGFLEAIAEEPNRMRAARPSSRAGLRIWIAGSISSRWRGSSVFSRASRCR